MLKRLFLTLLTCFALIFPGISVCATELQTDIEDSGDPANDVGKFYDNNDIFYYKPNYVAPKLNSAPSKAEPEVYGTSLDNGGVSTTYDDMLWELEELNMQFLKMHQVLSVLIWLTIILMFIIGGFIVHYIIVWPKYRRKIAEYEEIIAQLRNSTSAESDE